MSILSTDRAVKINEDFTKTNKDWAKTVSDITRQSDLSVQLTAWMHDNLINSKGDVDESDRVLFRQAFQNKMVEIQTQLAKLTDASNIYNTDATVYANNLEAFKVKYAIDITDIDARYK